VISPQQKPGQKSEGEGKAGGGCSEFGRERPKQSGAGMRQRLGGYFLGFLPFTKPYGKLTGQVFPKSGSSVFCDSQTENKNMVGGGGSAISAKHIADHHEDAWLRTPWEPDQREKRNFYNIPGLVWPGHKESGKLRRKHEFYPEYHNQVCWGWGGVEGEGE
jgi:hypothetical protein